MPGATDPDDPLLRAIAELRGLVDGWIDQQRAALHGRAAQAESPGPAPARDLDRPAETAGDDPRRRLDALARHLDDRLRRSSGG